MQVKELVSRVAGRAVRAGGILGRRTRLTLAVVVAALLAGPLATGDGELVFLNAVGLGLGRCCSGGASGPVAGRGRNGRSGNNGNRQRARDRRNGRQQ